MSEETKSPDSENEEPQASESAESTGTEVGQETGQEELQLQLEDARSKADEHWSQCLRLQAELENTRRRAERDVESAHKFALEKFTIELLPVKDSLEMGLSAATGDDETVARLREGTELTLKMFSDVLQKFGIREISPTAGEPFNPEYHQAMTMQESAEHPENTIVAVMQKGYLLNERLVRPAMVIVSKG
ncbi:nucleotide exchange factor GrpE [Thiohalomonas denitrificans]|uniref:Protein GrpE n=1 Tax=Thiohalomonas denitrificans TaxID=415747 RepID=A0A1G5PK26_9GAMM|nr:nucleotide exchange factor GrpE [Thiohalomonas denitrificans]SCZ49531.1 molecular chaperone GrpE [Thiohalomonas denitrificans]